MSETADKSQLISFPLCLEFVFLWTEDTRQAVSSHALTEQTDRQTGRNGELLAAMQTAKWDLSLLTARLLRVVCPLGR